MRRGRSPRSARGFGHDRLQRDLDLPRDVPSAPGLIQLDQRRRLDGRQTRRDTPPSSYTEMRHGNAVEIAMFAFQHVPGLVRVADLEPRHSRANTTPFAASLALRSCTPSTPNLWRATASSRSGGHAVQRLARLHDVQHRVTSNTCSCPARPWRSYARVTTSGASRSEGIPIATRGFLQVALARQELLAIDLHGRNARAGCPGRHPTAARDRNPGAPATECRRRWRRSPRPRTGA